MSHTKPILLLKIAVALIVFVSGITCYLDYEHKATQEEYEKKRSIEDAEREAAYQAKMAYRANLEIKMTESFGVGRSAIANGTIKNLGDKTVTDLTLIVYLVDAEGRRIGETNAIVDQWPYLKPQYVQTFFCMFDFLPPEIAGHEFEITRIKLADD
ncbi:MAG: FxLYD domain-containing protein [Planctomycetota bacterium]|nr:FxLYD domain-containing protein [Planctomycetota bacterium]